MPEKVRVSPASASQLSTGCGQAALVPEEDELLDDDDPLDEEPADEDPFDDEPFDEPEVLDEVDDESDDFEPLDEDESDFAGTEPLPDDRLSVR
jgi:hypothetical protein